MYSIKAFINYHELTNNQYGAVATIGELSKYSSTFARDVADYTDSRWEGVHMLAFSSKNNGATIPVPLDFQTHILEIAKWIIDFSTTASASTSKNDLLVALQNAHNTVVGNPNMGAFVTDGTNRSPDWVSWTNIDPNLTGLAATNEIRIWFADQAFQRDYDEFEIVVVPPVDQIDVLLRPVQEVQAARALRGYARTMELLNDARNRQPDTLMRAVEVTYYTPGQANLEMVMPWYCIVYGPAGDTPELMNTAIKQYIMANTLDTEDSWKQVLPDLFRVTQMYLLPMWQKMAIPSRSTLVGIHSPIVGYSEALTHTQLMLPDLATAHVTANLEITHHKFRSIALVAVGNVDNRAALYKLSDYIPDYIAESSNHQDFNRMSEFTKKWTIMMEELLMLAESYTGSTALPSAIRKVVRHGYVYLLQRMDNVDYLVAVKGQ